MHNFEATDVTQDVAYTAIFYTQFCGDWIPYIFRLASFLQAQAALCENCIIAISFVNFEFSFLAFFATLSHGNWELIVHLASKIFK